MKKSYTNTKMTSFFFVGGMFLILGLNKSYWWFLAAAACFALGIYANQKNKK
ncbi:MULTISPECIES: hypothetical protein [Enterococcus]|uniref:Uncharacterized protein n=1 Tax=Enterococcus alcedinis TaxID=1274384 RepID=A0A917N426_9ENTE|nr:hypothetical protein [Enterococcus alcedinis]MBP2101444.1 prophage antirepressor-like protein [Enterococcus alcedinis]GGI65163.1 hypothetical protein GCM10011482_08170 [Enterococcus alcedinis]